MLKIRQKAAARSLLKMLIQERLSVLALSALQGHAADLRCFSASDTPHAAIHAAGPSAGPCRALPSTGYPESA